MVLLLQPYQKKNDYFLSLGISKEARTHHVLTNAIPNQERQTPIGICRSFCQSAEWSFYY